MARSSNTNNIDTMHRLIRDDQEAWVAQLPKQSPMEEPTAENEAETAQLVDLWMGKAATEFVSAAREAADGSRIAALARADARIAAVVDGGVGLSHQEYDEYAAQHHVTGPQMHEIVNSLSAADQEGYLREYLAELQSVDPS